MQAQVAPPSPSAVQRQFPGPGPLPAPTVSSQQAQLGLVVAAVATSTSAILVRCCAAPALSIAAVRLVLASCGFVLALRLARQRSWASLPPGVRGPCLRSGVFLALHFVCWITSVQWTSVALAVLLVNTNPLFVGLGDALLLRQPPSRRLVVGIALGMLGAGLVALGDPSWHRGLSGGLAGAGNGPPALASGAPAHPWWGPVLALGGAFFGSAYMLTGRSVRDQLTNLEYVTPVYSTAALVLWAAALVTKAPLEGFRLTTWAALLGMALIPQGIGHTLINWALAYLPSARVALTGLLEPLFATVLAWLLLGEPVGALQTLGGLVVLAGVALAASPSPSPEPGEAS